MSRKTDKSNKSGDKKSPTNLNMMKKKEDE